MTMSSIRQRQKNEGNIQNNDFSGGSLEEKLSGNMVKSEQTKLTVVESRFTSNETKPELRRAGSSTFSLTVGSESDFSDEDLFDSEESAENIVFASVLNTVKVNLKNMTYDFQKSGLPWDGYQCRSVMAGGSGILYMLPSLIPSIGIVERAVWILQAFLSVMADYFHVHHDSMWHGIDRCVATFNTFATIYRAFSFLHPCYVVLGIIPVGSYIAANRAKSQLDLPQWHKCHFAWHITGSLLNFLTIYLLYHCHELESFLSVMCRN